MTTCVVCLYPMAPTEPEAFCTPCLKGEPVFNEYWRTGAEARLAWGMLSLVLHGRQEPFPEDKIAHHVQELRRLGALTWDEAGHYIVRSKVNASKAEDGRRDIRVDLGNGADIDPGRPAP
jgi:hypothetical protein